MLIVATRHIEKNGNINSQVTTALLIVTLKKEKKRRKKEAPL